MEGGASVVLPTLPIGDSADYPFAVHQRVNVSWRGNDLIEGAAIVVTAINITPSGLFKIEGAANCHNPDCAASFSFRPSHLTCSVAVRAFSSGEQTA